VSQAAPLVGIVRVSATRGRGGDSFISTELQMEGMRSWVDAHPEYALPDHFVVEELDVSGARPLERRAGLRRAVELVEGGQAAGIIGVRLNRLARSPEVYGEVKRRVIKAGGVLVAVDEGGIRSDDPEIDLHDDLSQSFAKYEVGRARRVFQLARGRAVKRGVATFPAPAGYDKILTEGDERGPRGGLVPNEHAAAIQEAFRQRATGASYNEIAAHLTTCGVAQRKGRSGTFTQGWSRSGTAHLLRNRVYLGELAAEGIVNPDAHEPIIDAATYAAAQRSPGARPSRESRHPFWLTRVARCAGCGAGLLGVMAHPRGRENGSFPIYRCQTRTCPSSASISAKKLEPFVERHLLAWLTAVRPTATVAGSGELELRTLEEERDRLQREVNAWRALPVADLDPLFFTAGLSDRLEPLNDTLAQIGQLRALPETSDVLTASLPEDWGTLTIDERRRVARAALSQVTVLQAAANVPLEQRVNIRFN